jgi:hypothetical protein
VAQKRFPEAPAAHEVQILFPQNDVIGNLIKHLFRLGREASCVHLEKVGFPQELEFMALSVLHELVKIDGLEDLCQLVMVKSFP